VQVRSGHGEPIQEGGGDARKPSAKFKCPTV
jgi:hypothetical protein